MSCFEEAVKSLIHDEGAAVNPHDNGRGPSKYGITLLTYREVVPSATEADIYDLSEQQAIEFYRQWAWDRRRLGLINDQAVATKMLNLGPNVGMETAIRFLQRAVGVAADGAIGPKTAAAVNRMDPALVLQGIRNVGAQHYRELVARRPEYEKYLDGWLTRLKG